MADPIEITLRNDDDLRLVYENIEHDGPEKFPGREWITVFTIPETFTEKQNLNPLNGPIRWQDTTYKITKIASCAFKGCDRLKNITILAPITDVGESAFENCSALESITIPETVKTISKSAFKGCKSLKSVVISNGVTKIGQEVFYACTSLKSIEIPDTVNTISKSAFENCSALKSINIPDTLGEIGPRVFANCNSELTSAKGTLWIPSNVEKIGENAFLGIDSVYYDGPATGQPWGAKLFRNKKILIDELARQQAEDEAKEREKIERERQIAEEARRKAEEEANIKAEIEKQKVIEAERKRAEEERLKAEEEAKKKAEEEKKRHAEELALKEAEKRRIEEELDKKRAEEEAKLAEEERLKAEEEARREAERQRLLATSKPCILNDESLHHLAYLGHIISEDKKEIVHLQIPSDYWYPNENGQKYKISIIEDSSFKSCDLKSINIEPNSVEEIQKDAFRSCELLETVNLSEGLKNIGNSAFQDCRSLKQINIPEGIEKLSVSLFEGCIALENVTLPTTLKEIERKTFQNCKSLKEIVLPYGLEKIRDSAFEGCESLKSIKVPRTVKEIGYDAFLDTDTLYYNGDADCDDCGAYEVEKYDEQEPSRFGQSSSVRISHSLEFENDFVPIPNVPKPVVSIPVVPKPVKKVSNEKEITLTEDLIFKLHSLHIVNMDLDSIVIPETYVDDGVTYRITKIGDSAFVGFNNLEDIGLPESIEEIGTAAFLGCKNLKNLVIPNGVKNIGNNAFYGVPQIEYTGPAKGTPWGAKSAVRSRNVSNMSSFQQNYFGGDFGNRRDTNFESSGNKIIVNGKVQKVQETNYKPPVHRPNVDIGTAPNELEIC